MAQLTEEVIMADARLRSDVIDLAVDSAQKLTFVDRKRERITAYCDALDAASNKPPFNVATRNGYWTDLVCAATTMALSGGVRHEVVRFLIAVHLAKEWS
jgi:hypothetical protein